MLRKTLNVAFGLSVCVLAPGCSTQPPQNANEAAGAADGAHDHRDGLRHAHPTTGPHGGRLIELGGGGYHAELRHDHATHTVTVDLLDAATTFIPTELDLNALTMEALAKLAPSSPKHPRLVKVAYTAAPEGSTVVTDPRVVMPLVAVALGIVAKAGARSVQLHADVDEANGTVLTWGVHEDGPAADAGGQHDGSAVVGAEDATGQAVAAGARDEDLSCLM